MVKYHYLFTNDLRVSELEKKIKEFSKLILENNVPTANENKSLNNSINTIGFYFNLKNKGNIAKLAANGEVKLVILNFIKKFQYPNPRTKDSLKNSIKDEIQIAPLREILKILFIANLMYAENQYLTEDEISDFIFYNSKIAKNRSNINRIEVFEEIINYRETGLKPDNIATQDERELKENEKRNLRELINILEYSNFIKKESGKIYLKTEKNMSNEEKLMFYDILYFDEYWEISNINEDIMDMHKIKQSYFDYFDRNVYGYVEKENEYMIRNLDKPHQRIFFGAPGTGKSYKLNKEAERNFDKNNISRVTFHPNYNYGNFIGTFKPFPKIKNDNETITYTYVPGILTKLLIRALNNPKEDFLLIIEEINRANTAAVFGDFFQLLDRDKNGNSEYDIVVSEDLKLLFSKNKISENINTECLEVIQHDEISVVEENQNSSENQTDFKLKLPFNFYIWATMNSADQGVMPLDTAFKRRWEFEYIGINDAYDKSKDENGKSEFDTYNFKANENELANWNDFRIKINEILSKCHVPEDKLLGPYFISKSILESGDPDKIKNAIKNKVLMYLYEDAGKQHRRKIFKEGKWETYSKLCEAFDKNCEKIFNDEIELLKSSPKEKAEKIIEQANENKDQNQENENVTTENNDSNDE
nr:AAA family ATPase [uncultured Leptotrichia sp.]